MRPVNLIPPEDRRGERGPTRTGPAAYVVVGVLVAALSAVTMVVTTKNKIVDRQAEIAGLEAQEAAAKQELQRLSPFASFATLEQAREATVSNLARSRFDWERVMRELAIVIPGDISLTSVTATVNPSVQLEGGSQIALRGSVPGPALELKGCAADHEAVARFAAALEDIDGVTRVAVGSSQGTGASAEGTTGGTTDCGTDPSTSQFEIIVAFDSVQVDEAGTPVPPAETAPTPASDEASADAKAQVQKTQSSAAHQKDTADHSGDLIAGTVR